MFYDDMEFLAVAEVSFCDPSNDFSFNWKIEGLEEAEIESVSGSSLKLAPGTFKSGTPLEVTVAVLNSQSQAMASVSHYLTSNDLLLYQNLFR